VTLSSPRANPRPIFIPKIVGKLCKNRLSQTLAYSSGSAEASKNLSCVSY